MGSIQLDVGGHMFDGAVIASICRTYCGSMPGARCCQMDLQRSTCDAFSKVDGTSLTTLVYRAATTCLSVESIARTGSPTGSPTARTDNNNLAADDGAVTETITTSMSGVVVVVAAGVVLLIAVVLMATTRRQLAANGNKMVEAILSPEAQPHWQHAMEYVARHAGPDGIISPFAKAMGDRFDLPSSPMHRSSGADTLGYEERHQAASQLNWQSTSDGSAKEDGLDGEDTYAACTVRTGAEYMASPPPMDSSAGPSRGEAVYFTATAGQPTYAQASTAYDGGPAYSTARGDGPVYSTASRLGTASRNGTGRGDTTTSSVAYSQARGGGAPAYVRARGDTAAERAGTAASYASVVYYEAKSESAPEYSQSVPYSASDDDSLPSTPPTPEACQDDSSRRLAEVRESASKAARRLQGVPDKLDGPRNSSGPAGGDGRRTSGTGLGAGRGELEDKLRAELQNRLVPARSRSTDSISSDFSDSST